MQLSPGGARREHPRRRVGMVAGVAVLACLASCAEASAPPAPSRVQPASIENTEPGPARCPDVWDEVAEPTGDPGDLVPTGATTALLCTYRYDTPSPLRLAATRQITTHIDTLSDYLNGLATAPPHNEGCLLGQSIEHAVVFGYPQDRAVAVRLVDCAWRRKGVTRYGGDIRKVTAYWGVRWNE